jgi:hypothetical protein
MIRDREIERLISYATGLGLQVIYDDKTDNNAVASWAIDGSEITLYTLTKQSKTELIIALIHELGHHLHWIYQKQRKPDFKFDEAITREMLVENKETTIPTPKHLRKKILDIEKAGAEYWHTVYKDVGLKIPLWKVNMWKEFDIWQYEVYYQKGAFASVKVRKAKLKTLTEKYKNAGSN